MLFCGPQIIFPGSTASSQSLSSPSSVCRLLPADADYVSEMLVDPESIGAEGGETYQRRVALVIGNSRYASVAPLKNPDNDAGAMAKLLTGLGFTVFLGTDLDAEAMDACVSAFEADLDQEAADLSLFFYAGHGVQLQSASDGEKRNYMLATDARVDRAGKGVGFSQIDGVLLEMRRRSGQAVFFYDACRNDPLGEQAPVSVDGMAIRRQALLDGAAAIEVDEKKGADQAGMYIAYATAPNRVADDAYEQDADHSPFTRALLNHIATPGYSLKQVMSYVANDVGELTDWEQTPWTSSSLTTDLRLNGEFGIDEWQDRSEALVLESQVLLASGRRYDALKAALSALPVNKALALDPRFKGARDAAMAAYNSPVNIVKRHEGDITSLELSPDGAAIMSTSSDRTIKLTDYTTGELIDTLEGHRFPVATASFNKDGTKIVSIDIEGNVIVWNRDDGQKVTELSVRNSWSSGIHPLFPPVFFDIASTDNDHVGLVVSNIGWANVNFASGETKPYSFEQQFGHNVADNWSFSGDGKRIAYAYMPFGSTDNMSKVTALDSSSGQKVSEIELLGTVSSIGFVPDTNELLIGTCNLNTVGSSTNSPCTLTTWKIDSGELSSVPFPSAARRLKVNQDGRTVHAFGLWDISMEQYVEADFRNGRYRSPIPQDWTRFGILENIATSPDGERVVISVGSAELNPQLITIVQAPDPVREYVVSGSVDHATIIPGKQQVATVSGSKLGILDLESQKLIHEMDLLSGHAATDIIASPGGSFLAVLFEEGFFKIISIEDFAVRDLRVPNFSIDLTNDWARSVEFSRDEERLIVTNARSFSIWSVSTGELESSVVRSFNAPGAYDDLWDWLQATGPLAMEFVAELKSKGFYPGLFLFGGFDRAGAPLLLFDWSTIGGNKRYLGVWRLDDRNAAEISAEALGSPYELSGTYFGADAVMSADKALLLVNKSEVVSIFDVNSLEPDFETLIEDASRFYGEFVVSNEQGLILAFDELNRNVTAIGIESGDVRWQHQMRRNLEPSDATTMWDAPSFMIDDANSTLLVKESRNDNYFNLIDIGALSSISLDTYFASLSTIDAHEIHRLGFRYWPVDANTLND